MMRPLARIENLLRLGATIYDARPDLQRIFASRDDPGFWVWLLADGCREYPAVQRLSVPVPSHSLRRYSSPGGEGAYLATGGNSYLMIRRLLSLHGAQAGVPRSVLDFGCGPGRTLRYMLPHADRISFSGSDVDTEAISWCRDHFPFGTFKTNAEEPPLPWDDHSFDLVYSISVFSHLSEAIHLSWLREIRRVLRPGGLLICTTHGPRAMERSMTEKACSDLMSVDQDALRSAGSLMKRGSFAFLPQPGGHLTTDLYGVSFIPDAYVRANWTREFDLLGYHPAALEDWQDAFVLAKGQNAC